MVMKEHEDAESEYHHGHGDAQPVTDGSNPSPPWYRLTLIQAVPISVYDPRLGAGEHVPGQDVEEDLDPLVFRSGTVSREWQHRYDIPHPAIEGYRAHDPSRGKNR